MTEVIALNPNVFSCNHLTLEDMITNHETLEGVRKVVMKSAIQHDDYDNSLRTKDTGKQRVVSIRSVEHQLYTLNRTKIGLALSARQYANSGSDSFCV